MVGLYFVLHLTSQLYFNRRCSRNNEPFQTDHRNLGSSMQFARINQLNTLAVAASAIFVASVATLGAQDDTAQTVTHRKFAPGVLHDIPSELNARDSFSLPSSLPGVNAEQHTLEMDSTDKTLYGMSNRVILYRDVYQYDYATTGLRQLKFGGKNWWYSVFRIRDLGETLSYEEVKEDPRFDRISRRLKKGDPLDKKDRFFHPRHTLEGWVYAPAKKRYVKVSYREIINPAVMRAIRSQEDPRMPLLDRVELSKVDIPKVKSSSDVGVWGVAIWGDVNPNIDYVSVYVSGLTDAQRMKRDSDDNISFVRKTLQMNYWRPGDSIEEDKDRIKFGIPLVDDPAEQVLITRRYNLPGPVIRAYERDRTADRKVLIMETDAMVNLEDFKSALIPTLDKGDLPEALSQAFAEAGISVNTDVGVAKLIEGKKWLFKQGKSDIELVLEPQYWEPDFEGIRFIKSLDFMWIYR